MRAQYIYEKFVEDSDPIQDMGIGVIKVKMDLKFLKTLPINTLEELYKRVHKQQKANVIVDGYSFDEVQQYIKSRLNNLIVKALKYKRAIENRDKVRDIGFKPGDAIKCYHKGKWWFGYPQFSVRGIIKTDGHGRITATTLTGVMKIPLSYAEKVTPKEQKQFDKEFFIKRKAELERQMNVYKEWMPEKYKEFKKEYDELLKNKKIKI